MDRFYRWVWDEEGRYVADPTHEHVDAFLKQLAYEDQSNADRSNYQKALQMLFMWRHHEHGINEYEPTVTFYSDDSASQPRDYLTREERSMIREASLEYGSIPAYNNLSPDQRDRWRRTSLSASRSRSLRCHPRTGTGPTAGRFRRWLL